MQHSAYLLLQNINPEQNKRRVYRITVNGCSVQLRWGRMDCHAKQKLLTFEGEAQLLRFLQATLKKRGRHGYQVAERGEQFPAVLALEQMKVGRFESVQLSLFKNANT